MSKVPTFSRRQAEEVRADVRPLIGRSGNKRPPWSDVRESGVRIPVSVSLQK